MGDFIEFIRNLEPGQIAEGVVSPGGVRTAVVVIVGIALLIAVRMMVQLIPARLKIADAVRRVSAFDTAEAFAGGFEGFSKWAGNHKLLGHLWREFVETLILPGPGGRLRVENTIPAGKAFTRDAILSSVNVRFYASVPNLLTGLGILGTFIGLVAGIYMANQGLAPGNTPEDMRSALGTLLHGAALAFLTSIAGLFCSLVFNGIEKRQLHRIDDLIAQWNTHLDSLLHRVTLESIGVRSLHEASEQRKQLERFNTELALQIASALDEKIAGRLAPQVDRLISAVEGMRTDQGDNIRGSLEGAVDKIAAKFEAIFSDAAGSEMQQLAQKLASVGDSLEGSAAHLAGGQQQLTQGMDSFASGMRTTMQQLAEEQSAQQMEASRSLHQGMEAVERRMAEMLGDVRTTFGQVNDLLSEAAQKTGAELEQQRQASSEHMQQVRSEISEGMEVATSKLVEVASIFETLGVNLTKSVSDSAESASNLFRNSVERADSLIETTARILERSRETFVALDSSIQRLGEVQRGLGESTAQLATVPSAISDAVAAVSSVESGLGGAVSAVQEALASIKGEHQQMKESFRSYEQRFEGVDRSTQRLFLQINSGLEAYSERVQTFTSDLEKHLGSALGILGGAIKDFGDSTEDLNGSIEELVQLLRQPKPVGVA